MSSMLGAVRLESRGSALKRRRRGGFVANLLHTGPGGPRPATSVTRTGAAGRPTRRRLPLWFGRQLERPATSGAALPALDDHCRARAVVRASAPLAPNPARHDPSTR